MFERIDDVAFLSLVIGIIAGFSKKVDAVIMRFMDGLMAIPGLLLAALFGYLVALTFTVWPLGYARDVPAVAIFREMYQDNRQEPRRIYVLATAALALLLGGIAILTADHRIFALAFVAGAVLVLVAFNSAGGLIIRAAKAVGRPRLPTMRLALTNLHRPGSPAPTVVLSLGLGLTVLVTVALTMTACRQTTK